MSSTPSYAFYNNIHIIWDGFISRRGKSNPILRAEVRSSTPILKMLLLASLLIHQDHHKQQKVASILKDIFTRGPLIPGHCLRGLHGQRREKDMMILQKVLLVLTTKSSQVYQLQGGVCYRMIEEKGPALHILKFPNWLGGFLDPSRRPRSAWSSRIRRITSRVYLVHATKKMEEPVTKTPFLWVVELLSYFLFTIILVSQNFWSMIDLGLHSLVDEKIQMFWTLTFVIYLF